MRARGRVGLAPLVAAAQLVHRRLAEALALARHHHGEARAEVLLLEPAAMHAQQVRLHLARVRGRVRARARVRARLRLRLRLSRSVCTSIDEVPTATTQPRRRRSCRDESGERWPSAKIERPSCAAVTWLGLGS